MSSIIITKTKVYCLKLFYKVLFSEILQYFVQNHQTCNFVIFLVRLLNNRWRSHSKTAGKQRAVRCTSMWRERELY